jgi:hypothetical protein
MSIHKYFIIPFESVPEKPSYTVWFATWSTERPDIRPGMAPPMVVGVTCAKALPPEATPLSSGSKDPDPPPPPPPGVICQADYQKLIEQWLMGARSEDE